MAMTTKERLHQLIDRMPESSSGRVEEYLKYIVETGDPVLAALKAAPVDDEPETEEERAAVNEAREDVRAGRLVSHEDIRREFGG